MADSRSTFVEGTILFYDGTTEAFTDLGQLLDLVYRREADKTLLRQIEVGGLDPQGSAFKAVFDFNSLQYGSAQKAKADPVQRYQKMLGEILLDDGIITEKQLAEALDEQKRGLGEERIGKILIRLTFASAREIYTALSKQYGIGRE